MKPADYFWSLASIQNIWLEDYQIKERYVVFFCTRESKIIKCGIGHFKTARFSFDDVLLYVEQTDILAHNSDCFSGKFHYRKHKVPLF